MSQRVDQRRRLHVAIVASEIWGRTGVSTHVRDLAKYLAAEGNRITLVSPDVDGGTDTDGIGHLRIPDIPGLPQPAFIFARLLSLHRKEAIDVVHVHDSIAFLGADLFHRVTGVRTVFTMQASILSPGREADYSWLATQFFRLSNRYVSRTADLLICPSREMAECALRGGASQKRIRLFLNPVDSELFSPGVARAGGGGEGGATRRSVRGTPRQEVRTCLFVGGFRPVKGAEVLVRAIPIIAVEVPEARFLLLGDGPERATCERLSRRLGVERAVSFEGHVGYCDLPFYYRSAELFIMPSLNEPMGLALMQALSCGLPVVASDVGGIPEIVEHGLNGLLVPPGDEQSLADAVIAVLTDRALDLRLREGARATGKGLTWRERIGQFTDEYRRLAGLVDGVAGRLPTMPGRCEWLSSSASGTTGMMRGDVASS
jgi:glycosyltransferase involved in cell wall biosynthesis